MEIDVVKLFVDQIWDEVGKVVIGQFDIVDLMFIVLFLGGYILLEGLFGIVKMLLM